MHKVKNIVRDNMYLISLTTIGILSIFIRCITEI